MPIIHAIILGLVQGFSEFLPISSSGHLQLVPWLFGWNDFASPAVEQTFDVSLHLGTLAGAVAYFRKDLFRYARAVLSSTPLSGAKGDAVTQSEIRRDARFTWILLTSTLPAGIIGALFNNTFVRFGETEWLIGVLLVVFGLVLAWADRLGGSRSVESFSVRDAIVMGMSQSIALNPGVSRSGVTITAGRKLGFSRDAAARLSFLMSLPIIAGAIAFEGLDLLSEGMPPGMAAAFAWGILASGLSGWLAVWGTLRLLRTRTFTPFVIYRVFAGLTVISLAASSLR